ncbi:ROK family protein [bacterium]|nr:MAG: ROK family protein [bacterium]
MIGIGIDLGGTSIKSALVDSKKGILKQFSVPTEANKGKDFLLNRLIEVVEHAKKEAPEAPVGVGIGAPGIISLDRKTVSNPPNLLGWDVVPLADVIEKGTRLPCRVENDANLAALGSARFGAGKDYEHFVMVTLGTGVGGGIIFNKNLFRGATGGAGELGHVMIDYNGPQSNSPTQGGIEAYIGQRFLSRYAADRLRQNTSNELFLRFKDHLEDLEPVDLFNAAKEGNAVAKDILRWAGEKLGFAIVNYVHTLDIRTIVVSGGVSRAGDFILAPAREAALSRMMDPFKKGFDILFETLGNDIALLGAGSLAMEISK